MKEEKGEEEEENEKKKEKNRTRKKGETKHEGFERRRFLLSLRGFDATFHLLFLPSGKVHRLDRKSVV